MKILTGKKEREYLELLEATEYIASNMALLDEVKEETEQEIKLGRELIRMQTGIPLTNYFKEGGYKIYRQIVDGVEDLFFDTDSFLDFLAHYANYSPNIYDFDSSGLTDSADLLRVFQGFGNERPELWDWSDCKVTGQFSSGWIVEIPTWEICFLKVTPSDEGGLFIPETINTFFLEGVRGGVSTKMWFA